ncbi:MULTISPECIES: hypothetical protein [unclassified Pseudarthrobacter]|uniref:hypothetical protein n=1 Tax=unclassified Pseudarthrobacter TaxID=2647000 RepID=UPI003077B111
MATMELSGILLPYGRAWMREAVLMADAAAAKTKIHLPSRLRAARIVAWVMVPVALFGLFGLADLMTLPGWVDQQYEWSVPLEASWGSLFTFVVGGSFVSVARNPGQPWPGLVLLSIAIGALLLGTGLGLDAGPTPVALLLAAVAALLVWLVRPEAAPLSFVWDLSRQYLLIAATGLPLWTLYAAHAFEVSRLRQDTGHLTWDIEHWPVQGSVGIVLCLTALAMAFWPPGRPLMRVATSLSATYIGAAMLAFPDRAGAMDGPMWGVAMVLWGTVAALPVPQRDISST